MHITVPSFYSATLGELLYRREPLPFGIDYQDPWVHVWPEAEVKYSKAWISLQLAYRLEPWATRNAALITGVASGYFEGVLDRNPGLRGSCLTAAMPYGFSELDFAAPAVASRGPPSSIPATAASIWSTRAPCYPRRTGCWSASCRVSPA